MKSLRATLLLMLALAGCAPVHKETVKEAPIAEVLQTHTPEVMRIPGVIGTGEGSENGERVFVVFANQRTPELDKQLPHTIGGYTVVVRVVGDVSAPPR
ncbi:MAG TPA: hypothetical protein VGR66_04245 [Candidatus Eisenbacteria bacterium]|jgi:hypothetical protein|nr:hypothetical protein [Candidatus Eisenbacteria bacterium]